MTESHEYDMALLTAKNHGEAYEYLRKQRTVAAVESLFWVLTRHHKVVSPMERQRVIVETLSYWQQTFDDPDCDE